MDVEKKVSVKFLLNNSLTGSLIGTGGKAIKELMAVSNARIQVSGPSEPYPGSSDRVVLISGSVEAVDAAQELIWEMLALMAANQGSDARSVDWSPQAARETPNQYDDVTVSARFTIPAAAGGAVLGKAGSAIQQMAADSGARMSMTSKEEALFTHERILNISGTPFQCKTCTRLVLHKLIEQDEVAAFLNKGTTYSSPLGVGMGMQPTHAFRGPRGIPQQPGAPRGAKPLGVPGPSPKKSDDMVADTTITLAVPDELIGNILGKQGSTMREIISLSGANVVVSKRGDFVDGTNNRLVTITGSPTCAQTAHLFITQRLQTPSHQPPRSAPRK